MQWHVCGHIVIDVHDGSVPCFHADIAACATTAHGDYGRMPQGVIYLSVGPATENG